MNLTFEIFDEMNRVNSMYMTYGQVCVDKKLHVLLLIQPFSLTPNT